jgi:hypothetical protein
MRLREQRADNPKRRFDGNHQNGVRTLGGDNIRRDLHWCQRRTKVRLDRVYLASMRCAPRPANLLQRTPLGFGQILHAPQEREYADNCVEPENASCAAKGPARHVFNCGEAKGPVKPPTQRKVVEILTAWHEFVWDTTRTSSATATGPGRANGA